MNKLFKYIFYFVACIIVVILLARWRVVWISNGYIFNANEIEKISDCGTGLVLGAKVYENGVMSGILEERALVAIDLYKKGKICNITISGLDSEVIAVRDFLIKNKVPKNVIQIDSEGKDTFASIKNMQDNFKKDDIIIITQKFHLSRAVYIARTMNLDANGFVAYKYPYNSKVEKYKDLSREMLASVKAVIESEIIKKNLTAN